VRKLETVGAVLNKLRELSQELKEQNTKMETLKEIEESDGLRATGCGPSPPGGGYRTSGIEKRLVLKERLTEFFQETKAGESEMVARMTGLLDSIQFRIRVQECNLLRDLYIEQLTAEEMKEIHGSHWEGKFRVMKRTYGGKSNEIKINKEKCR
jgi:hypothetical protein